jgi:hypothetical protein
MTAIHAKRIESGFVFTLSWDYLPRLCTTLPVCEPLATPIYATAKSSRISKTKKQILP